MFTPTHLLVSRSRQTPVQLISNETGFKILTESEFERGSQPAFEIRPRQGFFCQGIPVVGFALEPIAMDTATASENAASDEASKSAA